MLYLQGKVHERRDYFLRVWCSQTNSNRWISAPVYCISWEIFLDHQMGVPRGRPDCLARSEHQWEHSSFQRLTYWISPLGAGWRPPSGQQQQKQDFIFSSYLMDNYGLSLTLSDLDLKPCSSKSKDYQAHFKQENTEDLRLRPQTSRPGLFHYSILLLPTTCNSHSLLTEK